ncbi:hypothetical protein [Actinomadura chokoriensis]|uniref:DUF4254 domain-containing protein n=1 Tax=Actinomadura chokoriensis TaxID=454156 RepID=A0ABV4QZ21_9ACTN
MLINDGDRTRAGYIAGLRMLADLLEAHPDIPHYRHGAISFALDGTTSEAFAMIDRAAAVLASAEIEFERRDDDTARAIEFVLAGLRYEFSRMYDSAWEDYQAQRAQCEETVAVRGRGGRGRRVGRGFWKPASWWRGWRRFRG